MIKKKDLETIEVCGRDGNWHQSHLPNAGDFVLWLVAATVTGK